MVFVAMLKSCIGRAQKSTRERKRERSINAAARIVRSALEMAACIDDHEFTAADFVYGGRCVSGKRQRRFPEQFAGELVEGAELSVEDCCRDEDQSAGGHDWSSKVLGAGRFHTFCSQLWVLAQRDLPGVFAGAEVDRVQRSPGRLAGRISLRIAKPV